MKNILIIGAGKRVRNTILPALECLKETYTIQAICSRTKKRLILPDGKTTIETITDLRQVNFVSIDMIIVAATTESVPKILQQLTQCSVGHTVLFIDTPVVPIGDIWTLRLLHFFRAAYVSEDFIALANYQVAKRLVQTNHIGKLNHIYLFHNAYKYHALALLKTFIGRRFVQFAKVASHGKGTTMVSMLFTGGVRATLVGPRDYGVGRFLITGSEGSIADYPIDAADTIHLGYRQKNKRYDGITVAEFPAFSHHSFMRIKKASPGTGDTSLTNCLKIEGLVLLYKHALTTSPRFSYTPIESIYDNVVFVCIEKFGFFADIKLPGMKESVIHLLIRSWSRIPGLSPSTR